MILRVVVRPKLVSKYRTSGMRISRISTEQIRITARFSSRRLPAAKR
jgi:hypothetical protein